MSGNEEAMDAFEKIIFLEQEYLLIGDMISGGPIATKEQYETGQVPFAYMFENGIIMRNHEKIGTRSDLKFTGEFVVCIPSGEYSEELLQAMTDRVVLNDLMARETDRMIDYLNNIIFSPEPFWPIMSPDSLIGMELNLSIDMSNDLEEKTDIHDLLKPGLEEDLNDG